MLASSTTQELPQTLRSSVPGPWWVPVSVIVAVVAGASVTFGFSVFTLVCWVVSVPVVLAGWTDLRTRMLPLPLTLTALGAATAGVLVAGFADPAASVRAVSAGVVTFMVLTVIGAVLKPYAFGDVLLATPLAMLLGFCGWPYLAAFPLVTSLVAFPGAVIVVVRARSMSTEMPLGPPMIVATVVLLAFG